MLKIHLGESNILSMMIMREKPKKHQRILSQKNPKEFTMTRAKFHKIRELIKNHPLNHARLKDFKANKSQIGSSNESMTSHKLKPINIADHKVAKFISGKV